MKKINCISFLITVSFLTLIGWFSCCNFPILMKPVSDFIDHRPSIEQLNDGITKQMKSDDLFHKDGFINLNGLYGRLSGRRIYNDVVLLKNGYLTYTNQSLELTDKSIQQKTDALIDFNQFIEERSGHFIYMQFPMKYDMEKSMMPEGYGSDIPKETENLLESFQTAGIDVIDTQPILSKTAAEIEENFYRTDHHWKPTAAFKAFQIIMEHLQELYPYQPYDQSIMDINNWTVHKQPEWFLGSLGKRVGEYFAGLDSLYWMTPNWETEVSLYNLKNNMFYADDYETAFLCEDYIQNKGNILHKNAYSVYIGGDYPLTISRNPNAPSGQKLLIIKDSFTQPLQTFYAMVFREVDVIDPRYYTASTMKEYIDHTRPDIVVMQINPGAIYLDSYFHFSNGEDNLLSEDRNLLLKSDVSLKAKDSKYNKITIAEKFENEKYYTIRIPQISTAEGETDSFTVGLFDFKNNKFISQTIFDVDYCNKYGDCEWTFQAPESGSQDTGLLIYADIVGQTTNIGMNFENVQLYERSLID